MHHALWNWGGCLAALCGLVLSVAEAAAGPTITNVTPRGLQSGGTTTLTIDGTDLLPAPRLLLGLPGVKQTVRSSATAKRVQIEVTVDAQTPPGFYQFRLANEKGVSAPLILSIDALPLIPFAQSAASLPVAMYGNAAGNSLARTSFEGRAGQRIVADVEARRLGSNLNPVVRLYDAHGVQLAYAQTQRSLAGDARLDVVLPRDGRYTVEVHDALYRGANPSFFRLKLGELHYASLAYPLGVQQGAKAPLAFAASNLPSGTVAEFHAATESSAAPAPWPAVEAVVGGRPWVVVSKLPELTEEVLAADSAPVRVPAALNGRLLQPGEEDTFRLEVSPGMKLKFEMLAAAAGSPVDGVLTVRTVQGNQLATNDDRGGSLDPALDFTVPANTSSIVLAVRDLLGRGGEEFVYRVAVTDATQADFDLTVQEDRIEIPQGGTTLVRVQANRTAYNGPIQLTVENLPESVTLSGAEIPAGANDALVSFTASDASPVQALVRLVGRTADGGVERVAQFPLSAATGHQPWLATELAAAVTPPAPLSILWESVSTDETLPLGGSVEAKAKVTRRGKADGSVRVSLISTQAVPKKTVQNRQVDDLDRALRLDGEPMLAAGETSVVGRILVPGDLPVQSYDLALKAELLSADGKTVVAMAVSPARRFKPAKPTIKLQLAGEPKTEARAGAGETGKLTGKVIRSAGFDQPITLTLAGLPAGVEAPKHIILGHQSEFEFPVVFPFGTPAGNVKVKLVASSQLNAKTVIKAPEEIPVELTIVSGERPMPEQPLVIFEDQPEFASALSQGTGSAALATEVKYSGAASLRVKPQERHNVSLPGLAVKIRQYPGPGEYRYLRFAWLKEGGRSICLQLAHDGKLGPTPGTLGKFRYHAGPGPECFGASELVDNKIPTQFTVVTRDLFAEFGEFTLTGLGLAAIDGSSALFDHIYLARKPEDFQLVAPAKP